MIKTFLLGAIPLFTFLWVGVFYTDIIFWLIIGLSTVFASYMLGATIREELGDLRDRN